MTKVSKTARASMAKQEKKPQGKLCPHVHSTPMEATRVIKSPGKPGGMFWICPTCDHRERI